MAEPTAKFTLASAQIIADVVHQVQAQPQDRVGSRSIRRSYNERGFWAQITCYCEHVTGQQWKYSFREMIRTKDGWTAKPDGRNGDCCDPDGYALNAVEAYNGESDIQGNSIAASDPRHLLPVRGLPIVWLRMDFPPREGTSASSEASSRKPVFTFAYENEEADAAPDPDTCACTPPGSGSDSSQSEQYSHPSENDFHCVYAWTVEYDCASGTWGSVQRDGINCQIPPAQLSQWVNGTTEPTKPIFYWFEVGGKCDGPEQTSPCTTWPASPTSLPATPACESSSTPTSNPETDFVCVYAFTSTYDCSAAAWSAPARSGVNCQAAPSTTGAWVGNHSVAYWYEVGGHCPGPEQTAGCTTWPSPPGSTPGWTPNCGTSSESSPSSADYGGCPDGYTGTQTIVTGWDAETCAVTTKQFTWKHGCLIGVV